MAIDTLVLLMDENIVILRPEIQSACHLNRYCLHIVGCGVQSLPAPAQCLFLRLFQRKRHWFRLSTLSYSEVLDTSQAVAALTAAGFARTSRDPSLQGAVMLHCRGRHPSCVDHTFVLFLNCKCRNPMHTCQCPCTLPAHHFDGQTPTACIYGSDVESKWRVIDRQGGHPGDADGC